MHNVYKEPRTVADTKVTVNFSVHSNWPFYLPIITNSVSLRGLEKGKLLFSHSTMQAEGNQGKVLKRTLGLVVTNFSHSLAKQF